MSAPRVRDPERAALSDLPVLSLHGRQAELDVLERLLERTAAGRMQTAFIEGAAGIGKTRLLAELERRACRGGFGSFAAGCEELEQRRPFGALADALGCRGDPADPLRARIAAMLAAGAESSPLSVSGDPGLQFRIVEAFRELLEAEATARPVLLALDDLQWADPATLGTLLTLARRLVYLPLALVASLRPIPRRAELERLCEHFFEEGAPLLALRALDEPAVSALTAEALGARPSPRLLAKLASAGGNPLFITDLLRAARGGGAILLHAGEADVSEIVLPETLRSAILRRLRFLSPAAREALQVAAVLGGAPTVEELGAATERSAVQLSSALAEAFRADLFDDAGTHLQFRHDLIRECIYEDLPASLRAAVHREVAKRLVDAGAPPLRIAEHLVRGARPGDDQAVRWLRSAARETASRSPAGAVDLLDKTLALMEPGHPDRAAVEAERCVGLWWSGRVREAERACRELLDRAVPATELATARGCLTHVLMAEGRVAEAVAQARHAIASTSADTDRARARAQLAHARILLGDLSAAEHEAAVAGAEAERAGDALARCMALTCAARVRNYQGDFAEAAELAAAAVRHADASSDREGHRFHLGVFEGLLLLDLDRFDEAFAALQRGRRTSEELGARWNLPLYHVALTLAHFLAGRWDDAVTEYDASLELADETGTRHGLICAHSARGMIALHRGELQTAERVVALAEAELAQTGPHYRAHWTLWARAQLLEASGALPQAHRTLTEAWRRVTEAGIVAEHPVLAPDLVRLARAIGDRTQAATATEAAETLAARAPVAWVRSAALRCRGALEDEPGVLLDAAAAASASPRVLELAQTHEDAADALARSGRAEEARSQLEHALTHYEQLEAWGRVARTDAALRRLGVRRGRRGSRQRPTAGWQSLTRSERQVIELVAQGLSNPQVAERLFLSPRTVQTHLRHVFAKLSISSRTELAVEVARRTNART